MLLKFDFNSLLNDVESNNCIIFTKLMLKQNNVCLPDGFKFKHLT